MSNVRSRGWVRAIPVVIGVGCAIFGSQATQAEDVGDYVMRDGRRVGVTRSENEVGVVFRRGQDLRKSSARLQAKGVGTVRSFNGNPDARVKLLQYPSGVLKLSTLLLQSDVEEVRPVYRFAGFPDAPAIGSGTLVMRTRTKLSDAELQALLVDYPVHIVRPIVLQPNTYLLELDDDSSEEFSIAGALANDPRVLWTQPNLRRTVERMQVAVSDPFFAGQQWHLNNTGQRGGTPDADIDALEAWSVSDGQDILIGMFDDACDVDHEDLRDGYIGTGHDPSVADSNSPDFKDPRPKQVGNTHGTRVMGLAAARGNNRGGRGVAYQSRFTVSRGLVEALTEAEFASVFTFAIQQSVDVHNNSWGIPGPNPAVVEDAIELAFRQGRNKGDLDGDGEDTDDRRGMVILFSSGNSGQQSVPGFSLATLPWVLSIGASSDLDQVVSYSTFSNELDFLAPSLEVGRPGVFTTDNTDNDPKVADPGANVGGVNVESGGNEPDPTGNYTAGFSGTSASCPIATGVAALVLSVNPLLTAIDVRLIMAHTTDRINPTDAAYDGITSHSLKYGYGRLNAKSAVDAASQSLSNGGRTWPEAVANVVVERSQIKFKQNVGTDDFLIVQGDADFDFIPQDGKCYDADQLGCANVALEPLPAGVTVTATGCSLACGSDAIGTCELGADQCIGFLQPAGKLFFGIYARSNSGRYSFGVATDSDGNTRGQGEILAPLPDDQPGGGGGGIDTPPPVDVPAVTISASPIAGQSPLTVRFTGNAISARAIDESRTAWDFDISDGTIVNASSRNTSHTYDALAGERRVYTARLTMYDVDGNVGSAQVNITVDGAASSAGDGNISNGDIGIVVAAVGSPDSNVSSGTSPFSVILSVNSSSLPGTLQSIRWDLGDGTVATSLTVPHTYINTGTSELRLAVSATVTTVTAGGATISMTSTKLITVKPGSASIDPGDPNLPGAGVPGGNGRTACGSLGMISLLLMASPWWIRRLRA